jgi:hypothetical protein
VLTASAQLHQFRGASAVARTELLPLLSDEPSEDAWRLELMEETTDGFRLPRLTCRFADRAAFGTKQSGFTRPQGGAAHRCEADRADARRSRLMLDESPAPEAQHPPS